MALVLGGARRAATVRRQLWSGRVGQLRDPAAHPAPGELGGGRERGAVEPGDGPQHRLLHLPVGRRVELAQPGALPVAVGPDADRVAQVVQLHAALVGAGHRSGSDRPSSACHISGGMSSSTTAMPTWLTGLLVVNWMARSGTLRPRNTHTSPVRVSSTASSRLMLMDGLP